MWVKSLGRAAGVFPISLSEVFIYLLLCWTVVSVWVNVNGIIRGKKGKEIFQSWLWSLFLLACILFFLYEMNCGVNYHRESFSESSGIRIREYSSEELKEVCVWLTEELNRLSPEVERDSGGVMRLGGHAQRDAVSSMQALGETYDELSGYYPQPKRLIVPWILSVQNLSGIYSPFTVEANYNNSMTDYNIPFTMCHELSHLRGFMQEQEANFIAFLACRASENIEFLYSGNMMGWVYCMNVLRQTDYEAWEQVRSELSEEIEADLTANRDFWEQYDGAVAEVSNRINDTYLKANGQTEGVKSYNKMVDLIVEYYLYE